MSKACTKCHEVKPLELFEKDSRATAGRGSRCLKCISSRVRIWEISNIAKKRQKDMRNYNPEKKRLYYDRKLKDPEYRNLLSQRSTDWRKKFPEKRRAHILVKKAIKDGIMSRPQNCTYCGKGGRIEGHHPDYSKPLSVFWLCSGCHKKIHRGHFDVNQISGAAYRAKEG